MTSESPESETSAPKAKTLVFTDDGQVRAAIVHLNQKVYHDRLEDQRLAQMPDGQMVAELVQRKYLADLRDTAAWKKKNKPFKFDRRRRRKK